PQRAGEMAHFDHVILATGVRPRGVDIPGAAGRVIDYPTAFARADELGESIAVIGAGGIAVDLAHLLATPTYSPTSTAPATHVATDDRELFLRRHGLAEGPVPASKRSIMIMRRRGKI